MTQILTLVYIILFFSQSALNAQIELECKTKLSNFHEDVKAKRYDEAYADWQFVRANCPDLNIAVYSDGEKILKHKIVNTRDDTQIAFVNDLLNLWDRRNQYFKSKTPTGEYGAKAYQLIYNHRENLGKSKKDLYDGFDMVFKTDRTTFRHPKSLYTYFSLMVDLFEEEQKSYEQLFNTYDDISEKIEEEIQNYSEQLNTLIVKTENGATLNRKEQNLKKVCESYLKNYKLIQGNMDAIIDKNAKCENLIPLYSRDFEEHKNDSIWLKRSVNRMYHKECTKDELYEKLVKQYDRVAPSFDTKIFVATMLLAKGKDNEAYKYLEEAYQIFNAIPYKKSKLAFRIGVILKKKKQYSKARNYFVEALKLNPSNGKPHLIVAHMYAQSAKNCGKDNFHQRAVYWLAAKEARKASRLDPTLQKLVNQSVNSYLAKAPTRKEIFQKGFAEKKIAIKCWINRSITVPKLD